MENYEFIDNKGKKRFELHVGEYTCAVDYTRTADNEILLTHTDVPRPIEGQGFGSLLIKESLVQIEKEQLKLVPLCAFVAGYVSKHPEWAHLL